MKIKRQIYSDIKNHLQKPEITLIIGPRQVGKTTLINRINKELIKNGKNTVVLNMDFEDDFMLFETQSKLINHLKLELGNEGGYVFIDEIQRKENAGRFFKGIYDMKLPYKFIFTGSGSVELKEKISESLAGRKRLFEMHPITFIEFLDYETEYKYSNRIEMMITNNDSRITSLFEKYMHFGGYPRVILAETLNQKRLEIQEIYKSYLENDITQLLNVKKTESFTKLVTLLANQIGDKINANELSNTLGLDIKTINNYLWYLEKTYIIKIVRPYYTNSRKELTKTPLYYFIDLGLRNYALNRFTNFNLDLEGGHLFENFIFNYLNDKHHELDPKINYWRTKNGAEVDFIFRIGANILPIEIKYSSFSQPSVGKSMYNFISKYTPKKAYIINLTLNKTIKKNETEISFINFPQILNHNFLN